ncbi:leucine-rich repeat receptor-like protein kinase PEPR2 [Camellia sinensis]|uniref:leucine-rich repeat receptor-like protein kinase PEPR2 n=1 Tax=Camellia sinensis TaxID=4442 RepID=UPI001035AD8A|nr:leucine-rich repeat receptor-like protein kinase PEPR2 [Camellia sinensis]
MANGGSLALLSMMADGYNYIVAVLDWLGCCTTTIERLTTACSSLSSWSSSSTSAHHTCLEDQKHFAPSNLRKLNLRANIKLTDKLPNFNVTSSLQFPDLSWTSFSSQLPDSFSNLKALNIGLLMLTSLHLSRNSLIGTIPSLLFALPLLINIDLSDNKLEGPIPGSFYELQNLTDLVLSSNNLSGVVDLDMLLKLKNQISLDLSLSINNSVNSTLTNFDTIGLASCNLSEFPNFLREQAG